MNGRALGFVLAGGRSRRMGRDKALLPWGPATLLEHAAARLRPLCDDVLLLCGERPRYGRPDLPELPDAWPDAGPLGGLLAGLERLDERPGLFLAVDVPLVPTALLARLLALLPGHDAVAPVPADGPEPLVAVYARACAGPVRRHLEAGERKLTSFWTDVRVRPVGDEELRAYGDPRRLFANLNAPEDYARLSGGTGLTEP